MRRLDEYIRAGSKLLRCGYTTGTCAAAATRAAAELLLAGTAVPCVVVSTPAGIEVPIDVEEVERGRDWVRCAVRKDAGDDPDVTDGVLVWARVVRTSEPGVRIDGGTGVGRVTRAGLDQPIGVAAINTVPREMIAHEAEEVARRCGYDGGLDVEISIPAGVELARRTFNPRLGIEGGISVLGTSGIVRPMSEEALVASIALELRMLRASGADDLLVVPGNIGLRFARDDLGLRVDDAVSCANFVGATIDEALVQGFRTMLVVGHLGKLVKVAAGIMHTHSRVADGRLEVLAAHAALAGASRLAVRGIMEAATTDAALDIVDAEGLLDDTMASLGERLAEHLRRRAGEQLQVEAVVFAQPRGVLCETPGARQLLGRHRQEGGAS